MEWQSWTSSIVLRRWKLDILARAQSGSRMLVQIWFKKLAHGIRWLHSVASVTILILGFLRLRDALILRTRILSLRSVLGCMGNQSIFSALCTFAGQSAKGIRVAGETGWLYLSHLSALHLLLVPPPGMRTSSSLPKSFLWSEFVQRSTESTGCSTLSKKSMHLARCIWPESRQRCGIFRCVPRDAAEAENLSAVIASQAVCTASWTKHQ